MSTAIEGKLPCDFTYTFPFGKASIVAALELYLREEDLERGVSAND